VALLSFVPGAWPGSAGSGGANTSPQRSNGSGLKKGLCMKDRMEHQQKTMKSIDQMSKILDAGKQSNDPMNVTE